MNEDDLQLPKHSSASSSSSVIVDNHTHLLSTFAAYRQKFPSGKHESVFDFAKSLYRDTGSDGHVVRSIVDVWCEAPVRKEWKELADSAITEEQRAQNWLGMDYHFVMGVHPHEAKGYNDSVEKDILEAMEHPRCAGWGEIGLDYHYDLSPRGVQQEALKRQLRSAVQLGKPLTIHTREADEDILRILKEEVPKEHKIHIHCFTDTLHLAQSLLDHFPNLFIGITGVITYSTNENTSAVIRHLAADSSKPLRILLETDAPYMTPSNLYNAIPHVKGRLPICHTGMIPWTAEFVADIAGDAWDTDRVLRESRDNAQFVYGV